MHAITWRNAQIKYHKWGIAARAKNLFDERDPLLTRQVSPVGCNDGSGVHGIFWLTQTTNDSYFQPENNASLFGVSWP